MLRISVAITIALLVAATSAAADKPQIVLEVLKADGPNLLKPDAWRPYEAGFTRDGDMWLCDNAADATALRGLSQTIVLNQKAPAPILASAFSKADAVGGSPDGDYSLYLDLIYTDGTPLWGQIAPFRTGSHDWQRADVKVFPTKPVKSVTVNLLLRRHAGKAWFKQPQLSTVEPGPGVAVFDGLPVRVAKDIPEAGAILIRDVATGSDFVLLGKEALGVSPVEYDQWWGIPSANTGTYSREFGIKNLTDKDRAFTVVFVLPMKGDGWTWLAGPRTEQPAKPPMEYTNSSHFSNVGSNGQLSRLPLAAVSHGKQGQAVGVTMANSYGLTTPAFYRVGYSAGTGLLYIAWDVALTRNHPAADLHYTTYLFDGTQGFRGAVATMYATFPEQFRSRTPDQGLWMPFYAVSKVRAWEDFGFKFKEGTDETAWDNTHGLLTFRYTEPMTWWMPMPKDMPRTYAAALAEAKRLAATGNREAQALLTSGMHDESGRLVGRLRSEPWCDGIVWSMNSAPGVAGEVTDFKNKWNPALRDKLYPPQAAATPVAPDASKGIVYITGVAKEKAADPGRLSGEYVDSSEGYATDVLDFRRDHFAAMQTPLVFSSDTYAPAVFRGLVAWEYCAAISRDVHERGRLIMANGTPDRLPWLAPLFDVLGTETDWNPGGQWQPMSDDEMMVRRILAGPKPYGFLMNTDFDKFTNKLVEKYMKRCLAYGMFPGFFSANASTGHYFSRSDLYDRDRPLFKKYVPLVKRVAEAGWQPVTRASSGDPFVHVERFGDRYLTVFNDSPIERTVTLEVFRAAGAPPLPTKSRELVAGVDLEWKDGQTTVKLGAEDVAVIDLTP